jgi:hypothetical protein
LQECSLFQKPQHFQKTAKKHRNHLRPKKRPKSRIGECVGSVTTLLLAETKESERMDISSKQQRTYEESKRESGKRNGKSKEVETETGIWKSLNWESLKLETGK